MTKTLAALLLAGLPGLAAAQEEAPAPAFPAIDPGKIVSFARGDVTKDGYDDGVLLVGDDEEIAVSVYFFLGGIDSPVTLSPHSLVAGKLWGARAFAGQVPEVTINKNGSIQLWSGNIGAGRSRWEQTLTIAYRNEAFIVAGYTYSFYDTLDPEVGGSCDINLLTGKGKKNDEAITIEARTVAFADWDDGALRKLCGDEG